MLVNLDAFLFFGEQTKTVPDAWFLTICDIFHPRDDISVV